MTKESSAEKIGVLFGSFNPPHKSHARLVEMAVDRHALDQTYVAPMGQTFSKRAICQASRRHKFNMCKIAFNHVANCKVIYPLASTVRTPLDQIFKQMNILLDIQSRHPNARVHLIAGEDYITKHRRSGRLLKGLHRIAEKVHIDKLAAAALKTDPSTLKTLADMEFAHFTRAETLPSSSTAIRDAIMTGQNVELYLNNAVLEYIQRHALFNHAHSKPQNNLMI